MGDAAIVSWANVIIQIACTLARDGRSAAAAPCAPAHRNEFNAFFYTRLSRHAGDVLLGQQQLLVDQGYAFKVITELTDCRRAGRPSPAHKEEQLGLLSSLLTSEQLSPHCTSTNLALTLAPASAPRRQRHPAPHAQTNEAEPWHRRGRRIEISRSGGEADGVGAGAPAAGVNRKSTSMSALSGASSLVYVERDAQPAARPGHLPQNKLSREFGKAQKARAKANR